MESDSSSEDSDEDGESGSGNEASGSDGSDDGITFSNDAAGGAAGGGASGGSKSKKAPSKKASAAGAAGSSSEESDSDDDEDKKRKGVEGLIEVANPNLATKRNKKVSQLDVAAAETSKEKPQLSRREREEIEKQRAKARYQKLHAEGKTDEARADLARLAIIRKQREEAAAKRAAEAAAKEDASKSKHAEVSKAIGRKK